MYCSGYMIKYNGRNLCNLPVCNCSDTVNWLCSNNQGSIYASIESDTKPNSIFLITKEDVSQSFNGFKKLMGPYCRPIFNQILILLLKIMIQALSQIKRSLQLGLRVVNLNVQHKTI